jgi:acetylornithine deacetylase/succinyl-diaminopimelate desuccinylase-like protein
VLIYGHYDVIAAENEKNLWGTDPFTLTGKNGYLYGRGTSDNKVSLTIDVILYIYLLILFLYMNRDRFLLPFLL